MITWIGEWCVTILLAIKHPGIYRDLRQDAGPEDFVEVERPGDAELDALLTRASDSMRATLDAHIDVEQGLADIHRRVAEG